MIPLISSWRQPHTTTTQAIIPRNCAEKWRRLLDQFQKKLLNLWLARKPYMYNYFCRLVYSGPENLKKSRQKNSWNQINEFAFLAVLNFFPVQKFIFGHFGNFENLVKKFFREVDLFDFTSFFNHFFFLLGLHSGPENLKKSWPKKTREIE